MIMGHQYQSRDTVDRFAILTSPDGDNTLLRGMLIGVSGNVKTPPPAIIVRACDSARLLVTRLIDGIEG